MGLFSRKKSEPVKRSATRSTTSSEAQAAELRSRARRRLIGALVLVLTAIIVVPMLFDDTAHDQPDTPMVLPAIIPPVPEPDLAIVAQPDYSVDPPVLPDSVTLPGDTDPQMAAAPDAAAGLPDSSGVSASQPESPQTDADSEPAPTAPAQTSSADTPPKRQESEPPARQPDPSPADDRTDDGSLALALLEGRIPPDAPGGSTTTAQEQGNFVLQVAAYTSETDAQSRRTTLVNAGVTNAYVERAVLNDKTTYRLRVGSFPTRDAAQAAQARLRALGYDNSLLLTQ